MFWSVHFSIELLHWATKEFSSMLLCYLLAWFISSCSSFSCFYPCCDITHRVCFSLEIAGVIVLLPLFPLLVLLINVHLQHLARQLQTLHIWDFCTFLVPLELLGPQLCNARTASQNWRSLFKSVQKRESVHLYRYEIFSMPPLQTNLDKELE